MNKGVFFITIAITVGLLFTSCEKDDEVAKPVITIHELGDGGSHGNDYTAKISGELHIDIDIVAEGTINKIQVRIHPEGEHHKAGELEEWELDTTYTKFAGLKNTTFHEHVRIDSLAKAGDYHFDFIVTDMEGKQNSTEAELQIVNN